MMLHKGLTPLFYGRRLGRPLSASKKRLLTDLLPQLVWTPKGFSFQAPRIWMEIGFGQGEHLLQQLRMHPQDAFIGVEAFQSGLAYFLRHLNPADYPRVRLFPDNVHLLLPQLPEGQLSGIFILFPDPWPKSSHHKRRLIQPDFLMRCAALLQRGGTLNLASDDPALVGWMIHHLTHHPAFVQEQGATSDNPLTWPAWPDTWPKTRYYDKAHKQGFPCAFMVWRKCL